MVAALVGEEDLVPDFFGRHRLQRGDELGESKSFGMDPGVVVLADVRGLEPPRCIHRSEPKAHEAQQTEEPTDRPHRELAPPPRAFAETAQRIGDDRPVVPFGRLDASNFGADRRVVADGTPVTAISVRRREFSSVRILKDTHQRCS